MNVFLALLRKDWRLNRVPVVGLIVLGTAPYALGCGLYLWDVHVARVEAIANVPQFFEYMIGSASFSLICVGLVATAFGGCAFAVERHERWGDFLGLLPVSRWHIIISKLVLGIGCITAAAAVHGLILGALYWSGYWGSRSDWNDLVRMYACMIALSLSAFTFAWLMSAFIESAAIAACIALAILFIIGAAVDSSGIIHSSMDLFGPTAAISSLLGGAALLAGSVYYSRRIAP